jgi:hypothetical protein
MSDLFGVADVVPSDIVLTPVNKAFNSDHMKRVKSGHGVA